MRRRIGWATLVALSILLAYAAGRRRARAAAPAPVPPAAQPRHDPAPAAPALPPGPLPDNVTRLDTLPVLRAELDALEHEIAAIEVELHVAFAAEGADGGSGEGVSGWERRRA